MLLEPMIKPIQDPGSPAWNARVVSMRPSATLAMTARANKRRRDGHPVIALSAGEPDFDTPEEICEAAIKAIRDGFTHYTNNAGILELREAICDKLQRNNGIRYEPDEILCSNGAKQSVAQAVSVLCQKGDEVLIPAPYWVSYPEMTRFAGGVPVSIPTDATTGYRISPEQLESAITPETRILIICSPSNPTGAVYSPAEIQDLARVLEAHPRIFVISDEIYEHIIYDQTHFSIASIPHMRDRTVTVNGFSKAYAMTGWRLGYLAADRALVKECAKLQSQMTSAPSSISQMAGLKALQMSEEPIKRMVRSFRERRDYVLEQLAGIDHLNCPVPDGAFYVFPDISAYLDRTAPGGIALNNTSEFCIYILDSFNVALVPGEAFGGPTGVRISYAASMSDLEEAMGRLKTAYATIAGAG